MSLTSLPADRDLRGLQSGIYQDGVVRTDPVVMSPIQAQYGPTDLGGFHTPSVQRVLSCPLARPIAVQHFWRNAHTSMALVPRQR